MGFLSYLRKLGLIPGYRKFLLYFFFLGIYTFSFYIYVYNPFWVHFVYDSRFNFLQLKRLSFLPLHLCQKNNCPYVCRSNLVLFSDALLSVSILMPMHTDLITIVVLWILKSDSIVIQFCSSFSLFSFKQCFMTDLDTNILQII